MKKGSLYIFILVLYSSLVYSQVAVNTSGSLPDPSAMLDISATNRGLLIPRISTAARDLIPSPAPGLKITLHPMMKLLPRITHIPDQK